MQNGDIGDSAAKTVRQNAPVPKTGFKYNCYLISKRIFDLVVATIALIVLSPVILIAIFIKWLEDFKNPIYVSKRVGKGGREFNFFKIRTMRVNADKEKEALIAAGLNEADGPAFKIKNDPRITKIGRIYRKLSIDELPQLINIINGTMSLVGPRPPIPSEVANYDEVQMHRLDVKGGLLCLWQVQKNRNDISFDRWVELDFEYIEKQSFLMDLKIIMKGFWVVLIDRSGK